MSAVRAYPRCRFTLHPVAAALAAALASTAFPADTALHETVVTATRSEAAIDDPPVTVTAVTRKEMDRRLPGDAAVATTRRQAPQEKPWPATPAPA